MTAESTPESTPEFTPESMTEVPLLAALARAGLNLHAVFAVDALPAPLRAALAAAKAPETLPRVWLIGHGGRALWARVSAERARGGLPTAHPIDAWSVRCVREALAAHCPAARAHFLYPQPLEAPAALDLQRFGALAGWHHPTPFMVGINAAWGTWFAYRALLLTDAPLEPTPRIDTVSPCLSCVARPCRAACPAGALGAPADAAARFDLGCCVDYRLETDSACAQTCRARLACPVAPQHRYDDAQLAHCYGESLRMLRDWRAAPPR